MAEDVRITMSARRRLNWPTRCARCGETGELVWLNLYAVRMHRPLGERAWGWKSMQADHWSYVTNGQKSLPIPVPMCLAHARANQLGGVLLCADDDMRVLRLAICLAFAALVQFALDAIAIDTHPLAALGSCNGAALALFGFAAIGAAALLWADRVAWIRPLRLDHARETAVLRLRNESDAAEFLRNNPSAAVAAPASGLSKWLQPSPPRALAAILLASIAWQLLPSLLGH